MAFLSTVVHVIACVAVAVVTGAVMLPTVSQHVPGGDSGELIAEACSLGVAHPPGYPLWTLLMHVWVRASAASMPPAFAANVASTLMACITAAVTCSCMLSAYDLLSHDADSSPILSLVRAAVAACVALTFAFTPLHWLYAIGAEVFSLNNLLCICLVRYMLSYATAYTGSGRTTRRLWLAGGAFLCGLCICNQHTSILLVAPLSLWMLVSHLDILTPADVLVAVAAAGLGLLPYAHLPLSQLHSMHPGSWGDTRSVRGFLRHFLRQDYGTLRLFSRTDAAAEGFAQRTAAYVHDLLTEQLPSPVIAWLPQAGAAAAAIAWWKMPRNARGALPAALVLALIFYFAVFHSLSNMPLSEPLLYGVHQRFWLQPNLLVAVLSGVGALVCCDTACTFAARALRASTSPLLIAAAVYGLGVSVAVGAVMAQLQRTPALIRANAGNGVVQAYGRALLEPLPPGAILITGFDFQWTATRYLQACEGVRPDVVLLNAPMMTFDWFEAYRGVYPSAAFPGTHLTPHMTEPHAKGGFSLADFLIANLAAPNVTAALLASYVNDPPHGQFQARREELQRVQRYCCNTTQPAPRSVFIAGTFIYTSDDAHSALFELQPYGIVTRGVPKFKGWEGLTSWRDIAAAPPRPGMKLRKHASAADMRAARRAWDAASAVYNGTTVDDSSLSRYDNRTWELATRIDYWNQAVAFATWELEWATADRRSAREVTAAPPDEDAVEPASVLHAAYILEDAMRAQLAHGTAVLPTTYKNLGLAYVKIVRYKSLLPPPSEVAPWPRLGDAATIVSDEPSLRTAAAQRVLDLWGHFITLPASASDSSISTIRSVVKVLRDASAAASSHRQQ